MSEPENHEPDNHANDLFDLGEQYLQLIGSSQDLTHEPRPNATDVWTGVVSTEYFAAGGCVENNLEEDVVDAWQDIASIRRAGVKPWEFIFNAKDHELPDWIDDLEIYRLSDEELMELGQKVTRLRDQIAERAATIKAIGYVEPSQENQAPLDQRTTLVDENQDKRQKLAKEHERREPNERGLSHKFCRRRYCDLSVNEVLAIVHAVKIQHRFHRDIAQEFKISIGMVSRIARNHGSRTIEDRLNQVNAQESQITMVRAAVAEIQ